MNFFKFGAYIFYFDISLGWKSKKLDSTKNVQRRQKESKNAKTLRDAFFIDVLIMLMIKK